jgi:hypothetical protein
MFAVKDPPTVPPSHDNEHGFDSHGMAALLLTESLIHGLCENTLISTKDAVNIVERAASVQLERATRAEHGSASMWQSHALLTAIRDSLRADLKFDPFKPKLVT